MQIKVKSVKKIGKAPVYNMYVEDVNCYAITKSNIISHNCLAGNTLVFTTSGYKRIDELVGKVGKVITIDPKTHERVVENFRNVVCNGVKPTITITFDNGERLTLTEDHRVLTKNGWVEAGKLTEEDDIVNLEQPKVMYYDNIRFEGD